MKIAITAESTIDLPQELLEKFDIHTIPFHVLLGDNEYKDGEVSPKDIFDYVKKTKNLPKTSAVNQYDYEEFFKSMLENYDAVVHFALSSEISSSCSNAKEAAKKFDNVYVVDSRSLSTGIALQAIYANKLALKGLSAEEVYKRACSRVGDVQAGFILDRLDYLYKGGRCSALQLFGANLLKLKPEIAVRNGKMGVEKKYRGKLDEVLKTYAKNLLEKHPDPELDEVFITYSTADQQVVDDLTTLLKARGFKNVYTTTAGCTITSHCGENCLGVLFMDKPRY